MGDFQDMSTDMAEVAVDYHGEEVTFIPSGASGVLIDVVMIREPTEEALEAWGPNDKAQAMIPRSARSSLSIPGDRIKFAERYGDEGTITLTVSRLVQQHQGYWQVGLS